MVDNLFLLAIAALGWGLSLSTYRLFAQRNGWPMGALQADLPFIPVLLGLIAFLAGLSFAAARGYDYGGLAIVISGVLLAVFWTGFLRVGSQISLFLAPVAAFFLMIGWLGIAQGPWARETLGETLTRKRDQAEDLLRDRLLEKERSGAPAAKNGQR